MPTRISYAPRTIPPQDVLRFCNLPEGKILRVTLVFAHRFPRSSFQFLDAAVREFAVFGPACHVEIHVTIGRYIGMALVEQRLDHFDLLWHMTTGARADIGTRDVEGVHICEITARVGFHNLHWLGLRLPRL